jgi:nucleotide-binding universal stress UspA family protein
MQYRTILLNLNDELRVPKLVKSATSLATSANAHIVGLYVLPSALPPAEFIGNASNTWMEAHMRFFEDQAKRIKVVFEDLVQGSSFTHEWRFDGSSFDKSIADSVIEHGYASDLIIVGQGSKNVWLNDVPERAVIESGRPVLVVPSEGDFQEFGSNIMIAWKKSKEATRAVFDALSLLQKARNVRLVTLAEDGADEDRGDQTCADVAALLQRHGIDAEIEVAVKGDLSIGDSLIEYAQMRHHDMLVMGLYGHSRFREFFLGGASRDVLQHMSLPVLMSH